MHVPAEVGTAKPAVPAHAATAAALARVHSLAKQGMARAYIGANTTDPDDGIKGGKGDAHYCDGCNPPLKYGPKAPVMNTTGAAGVTITPIYWTPTGKLGLPAHYEDIINGYLKNIAAASGATTNVYSVSSEYYQTNAAGVKTPLRYKFTAGTPIVDTSAYPPVAPSCVITDSNLEELRHRRAVADRADPAEGYERPDRSTCRTSTRSSWPPTSRPTRPTAYPTTSTCSVGTTAPSSQASSTAIYGNEPWSNGDGCGSGEDPNGVLSADTAIDVLSHEVSESLTDPTDNRAWNDSVGYEIGDICSGSYGPLLGFAKNPYNPSDPYTAYNQTIGTGKYYTQTEFSNAAYSKLGTGAGCITGESALKAKIIAKRGTTKATASTIPVVGTVNSDPFPNTLPADGTSTSDLDIIVERRTASPSKVTASTTPPMSTRATELAGRSARPTLSPTAVATPTSLTPHRPPTWSARSWPPTSTAARVRPATSSRAASSTRLRERPTPIPTSMRLGDGKRFQVKFLNPTVSDTLHNQVHVQLTTGPGATNDIDASQVHMTYALNKNGPWLPVKDSGTTSNAIQADILPPAGVTIPAQKSLTIYFHMQLAKSIDTSGGGAGFYIESYLEQVNTGSGAISTYGDTLAYPVDVLK